MCDLEPDASKDVDRATTSRDQQPFGYLSQEEREELAWWNASGCWGSNKKDLWNNEKHMKILYNKLSLVKQTLLASTNILCDNLKLDDMLRSMKAKTALTPNEVTEIRNQINDTKQVDKLIGVLMRKPVSAYNIFMDILQEERLDLYSQIKTIEKRQALKRKHNVEEEKISYIPLFGNFSDKVTLSDRQIEGIVDILKPNELKRLFKELNITSKEIEEAIQENQENMDPKEKARLILRYWREIKGPDATKQKILDALVECRLKYKALVLEEQWGARYAGAGIKGRPPEVADRDDAT